MKKILHLLSFFVFALPILAQQEEARKIDEFESIQCDDYLARMDAFQNQLKDDPTAKGYILIYEGKIVKYNKGKIHFVLPHLGEAKSYERTMIRRMAFRRFDKERIVFVEAGFRENLMVEFWLVPQGAKSPNPTPTLKKMKYQKGKPIDFCDGDVV